MAFTAEYVYRILDRYSGPLNKIVRSQNKYIKAVGIAQVKTRKLRQDLNKFGQDARRVGGQMSARLTLPIAAVGAVGVVAFAKLEKGLINVNNLLSKPELKRYGANLERLQDEAVKAGFSIDDVNQGLFDTISALGAGDRSFKTFAVAQKLAIGGATTLGVAVDGLSSIMSVYKDENVTAFEAANALFSAQVKGKTTVEALSSNIGKVAPIAKAAGIGYKELLAAMSALTVGGLSTEESSTALRGAISALIKPEKQAEKMMKRMGIIYGASNIKAKGFSATLRSLADAQKKYGLDAIAKAIPNIRALTAVTAMNETQLALMDETIKKINSDMKSGDGLMRAFADQNSSMSRRFVRAKGQMTVALKSFVVLLAPAINATLTVMTLVAKVFSKIPRDIKVVILIFITLLAVIGPLVAIIGGLAFAVSSIIAVLPILALGFAGVATFAMYAGIAMGGMLLPILAIVVAVGSLAFALQQVIANWETLKRDGFLKDLKGFVTFQDPNAGIVPAEEGAQGAAVEKQQARIAAKKAGNVTIDGEMKVSASGGATVESANMTANAGSNMATVGQP